MERTRWDGGLGRGVVRRGFDGREESEAVVGMVAGVDFAVAVLEDEVDCVGTVEEPAATVCDVDGGGCGG